MSDLAIAGEAGTGAFLCFIFHSIKHMISPLSAPDLRGNHHEKESVNWVSPGF